MWPPAKLKGAIVMFDHEFRELQRGKACSDERRFCFLKGKATENGFFVALWSRSSEEIS